MRVIWGEGVQPVVGTPQKGREKGRAPGALCAPPLLPRRFLALVWTLFNLFERSWAMALVPGCPGPRCSRAGLGDQPSKRDGPLMATAPLCFPLEWCRRLFYMQRDSFGVQHPPIASQWAPQWPPAMKRDGALVATALLCFTLGQFRRVFYM